MYDCSVRVFFFYKSVFKKECHIETSRCRLGKKNTNLSRVNWNKNTKKRSLLLRTYDNRLILLKRKYIYTHNPFNAPRAHAFFFEFNYHKQKIPSIIMSKRSQLQMLKKEKKVWRKKKERYIYTYPYISCIFFSRFSLFFSWHY